MRLGYTQAAAHEIALWVALGCFYNRVTILIASPPEHDYETWVSAKQWWFALAGPVMRMLAARRRRSTPDPAATAGALRAGAFGRVLEPLAGLPGAWIMKNALDGAFASGVLSRAAKALMFAIVARTLECGPCEGGARELLQAEGYAAPEIDEALAKLGSARLSAAEAKLLPWVRSTVHYQTGAIQQETRALAAAIGPDAALEAIGVAALANATARLAMLVE